MPICGIPCVEFAYHWVRAFGIEDIAINVHAHADKLRTWAVPKGITVLSEESHLLGSAGGYRNALEWADGPFLGVNADVLMWFDLDALAKRHAELRKKHGVVMTLAVAQGHLLNQAQELYREFVMDHANGTIHGYGEKKANVPYFLGIGVFEREAFVHLPLGTPQEFVPDVLDYWIPRNRVGFLGMDGLWSDIGSPELWASAHVSLMRGLQSNSLNSLYAGLVAPMRSGFFPEKESFIHPDYVQLFGQHLVSHPDLNRIIAYGPFLSQSSQVTYPPFSVKLKP